ncbi:hypothetical protein V2J09_022403 [Rumex salicifolius]
MTRVFHAKHILLKHEIIHNKIFSPVAARIPSIENPHLHAVGLRQIVHGHCGPEKFDQYVCAKITSIENPYLYAIGLRHIIHGRYGPSHLNWPCMK